MASNKSQNKIIVGVLSSSMPSVVQPFLDKFKQVRHDKWTFDPIFIQLSAEDLDDRDYEVKDKVKAVVLLHSILEGRLSVTDVPDAKYNNLLPRLKDLFGLKGVGVIAHSMPAFSDVTKPAQMEVLRKMQPATFESSGCVNICGKLDEMSEDDWTLLTRFLSRVPGQRKLPPSDGAEKLISKKKSTTQKSGFVSSHSRPQQADIESPRKLHPSAEKLISKKKSTTQESSFVSSQSRPQQADSESPRKLQPSDGAEKLISKKKSTTQESSFVSSQSRPQQDDSESPRKLQPSDGAEKLISKKKSTKQESSFVSSQSRPQQDDSESPRKHMKANEPNLVIITPEGDLDSVKIIAGDKCKEFLSPIKIEIYANSDELDAEWKSAHAQALPVPDTDLVVCITRFHGKKEEM